MTNALPQPLLYLAASVSLALTLLVSSNSHAQTEAEKTEQSWYQIEVFIFAYDRSNTANASQEAWPQELGLKYPQRIVQLQDMAQLQEGAQLPENLQLPELAQASNIDRTAAENFGTIANDAADQTLTLAPEQSNQQTLSLALPQLPLTEQPFTLLPADQLSFHTIIKRLTAQRDIRPLFHAAWRQPIQERKLAESVLIRGGDQFDNHYELEGSISIGLERYLHISTDLWLSSFVSNAGLEKTLWPVLPPIPVTSNAAIEAQAQDPFQSSSQNLTQGTSQSTGQDYNQAYFFSSQGFNFGNPFLDTSGNLFSVEQTVTMRQQRRMRSQELHYLDHPLMGLLVRITQYERPVEEPVEPTTEDDSTE